MARKRSEDSRYKSPSSGEYCTAQQLITEILMTREAKRKNKTLPYRFWELEEYKAQFQKNIIILNKIVKSRKYEYDAIINVLTSKKASFVYNLYYKPLDKMIKDEMERLNRIANTKVEIKEDARPRDKTFGKKSIGSKLD